MNETNPFLLLSWFHGMEIKQHCCDRREEAQTQLVGELNIEKKYGAVISYDFCADIKNCDAMNAKKMRENSHPPHTFAHLHNGLVRARGTGRH